MAVYTKRLSVIGIIIFVSLVIWPAYGLSAQSGNSTDLGWPRVFQAADGTTDTVFQPQLDSWDGFTLKAYAAVAVQQPGDRQPLYGVAYLTAHTIVDKNDRVVNFSDLAITGVQFPSAPGRESSILAELRRTWPQQMRSVSLDRLEASISVVKEQKKVKALPIKNIPPRIIFSQRPAVLVYIDGEPRYSPIVGSSLFRVLNTRVLLVKDTSGKLYLHLFNGYMEAPEMNGPWAISRKLPNGISVAENAARNLQQVDMLKGQVDPQTNEKPTLEKVQPQVFISTTPAELIVTEGKPEYVPIAGTELLYVNNTSAHVFKYLGDQKTYVLISGRWFRSGSLFGPWEYVPGKRLPPDFVKIPDDSPKENVKASIPGTQQAEEALIANTIPQTANINRKGTNFDSQIDGDPQLSPIGGTPLSYVINSPTPIIEVNERSWYACEDGVWFVSSSVNGPWAVADSVPAVIYSIPPSSPISYVTYVRVYNATQDYVCDGYTPGYYGCVVSPEYVVVYGTGYYYHPWIGRYWYGPPITYGCGSSISWTPWGGWSFSFGFGWLWNRDPFWYYPPAPWWGPFWGWRHHAHHGIRAWGPGGWASTTGNNYRLWGKGVRVSKGMADYSAITGNDWSRKYGMAYNSKTGSLIAGHRNAVRNVFIVRNAAGTAVTAASPSQRATPSAGIRTSGTISSGKHPSAEIVIPSRGMTGENKRTAEGNVSTGIQHYPERVESPGAPYRPSSTVGIERNNNVYATHEGKVFLNQGEKGNWHQVNPLKDMSRVEPARIVPHLEQERSARIIGQQRSESFHANRPAGGFNPKESEGRQKGAYTQH
jgi:hypothetical protein